MSSDLQRMGVVGAGQMGRGIAQVAAAAGLLVTLCDANEALAEHGKEVVAGQLARLVDKGRLSGPDRDDLLGRITCAGTVEQMTSVDIVVEAASEDLDVKLAIFRSLDAAVRQGAILASNTSSISITRLAAATGRPPAVIGMHFMNPVPLMKLCEVVRGTQTSTETYDAVVALAVRLGKQVITSEDRPGFLVNRMLIPLLNEACFALQEGVGTAADIDTGARLGLNHPMGPLELADLIGLDTVLAIADVLLTQIGDPKYRAPSLLRNLVAAGWLGRKSGRGFYRYDERGNKLG